jgi:hypothetical protein
MSLHSTLAMRHQLNQAYKLSCCNNILKDEISLSKTVQVDFDSLSQSVCQLLVDSGITTGKALHICRFAKVNGTVYYKNMYIIVSCRDDLLTFGRIQDIFVQDVLPYFCLQLCTGYFHGHLSAF